jgi:uracil-DNA glycosylase
MDSPSLLSRRDAILKGVDPAWLPLIDTALLDGALGAIDAMGDAARTAPPPHLIFEALRYGAPADTVAFVNAQDPYPTPGDAQGVCFSVPAGTALPESLKRIFGCLDRAGLRREHAAEDKKTVLVSGDLRPWAVQGVLMFNSALTTRVGERRAHAAAWKPFVDDFLRRFCAERAAAGASVHFLLWGGDARAYAGLARRHKHAVHEWSHPSPLADNKLPEEARFRACPHFEEVNAALAAAGRRPVVWDNLSPVVAFSDGSCPLNGKPGARASFAALVTGAQFGAAVIRGEVCPTEYAFLDEDDPERGIRETQTLVAPSNNRGELLGIIYAFLALLRGRAVGRVELISDSEISVNTLLDWLPKRLKKKTERDLKNYDLVMIAWRLLGLLREQAACVVLTHTRSHQKPPPTSAPSRVRFVWKGNDMADKHADAPLTAPTADYAVEVLTAPAVLQVFARPGASAPPL